MKTLTDSGTIRIVIGLSVVVSFVFPGSARAMPEYGRLQYYVAEFTQAVEASIVGESCRQAIAGVCSAFVTGDRPTLQALVDELESDVQCRLCAVALAMELGGNRAAGTRVRKQMQMIKQAAQLVRNRVLEIRSIDEIDAYGGAAQGSIWSFGVSRSYREPFIVPEKTTALPE